MVKGGVSSPLVLSGQDSHLSVKGHRLIADSIFQCLASYGLVDRILDEGAADKSSTK